MGPGPPPPWPLACQCHPKPPPAFWTPSPWQPHKLKVRVSLTCMVAARPPWHPRSPEPEGGASRSSCGVVKDGRSQSAVLAFSGSLRIAKFFSNLQLLDVGENHQRGSPLASTSFQPQSPPPQLSIFFPSGAPSHPGLLTYSCVYLLFHWLRLSCRGGI